MTKHNAAIYVLSSRVNDLGTCLKYLHDNWNKEHQYPIYVNHFDNIYSKEYIDTIKQTVCENIPFEQIPYQRPDHIEEEELYYNRKHLQYVRERFSINRMGYLHMCHYTANITSFGQLTSPSKSLEKYDYLMRIDDDSWFKKPISEDLFDYCEQSPITTAITWNHYGKNHLDTRENLWSFYKSYLTNVGISYENIKSEQLKKAVKEDDEHLMHSLHWSCGNLNMYNMKMFKTETFDKYISHVNEYSGTYKHRWTDLVILGLFCYTHFENPVNDLKLKDKGLYDSKLPTSSYAPSVRSMR